MHQFFSPSEGARGGREKDQSLGVTGVKLLLLLPAKLGTFRLPPPTQLLGNCQQCWLDIFNLNEKSMISTPIKSKGN